MTESVEGSVGADVQARAEENKIPEVLSLEILRVIREAQQQHGLRHGDYQRYRGYCSRRVRRLRKVLKIPQGDRRHYRRRDVTAAHLTARAAEARLLCIPLAQAERAWAHAMQLRQEANTEPRKRFHLVQRLRKATAHAAALLQLAEGGSCCPRTQLEAQAYAAWLQGVLQLELQAWPLAAEQLARAQLVYQQLGATLPEHERALYLQKAEELTPSLRYCAYNIGDESAAAELRELRGRGLPEEMHALMSAAAQARGAALHEVEWRGRRVAVRPERVRVFLAGLRDLDAALEHAASLQARVDLLESVLMDCKDAIAAVRDDAKADPKLKEGGGGGGGGGGAGALSPTQHLLSYLTYLRLTHTVARNNLLVQQAEEARRLQQPLDGKKVRARDLTRLYEIILQNYTELAALPGLEGDAAYQAELALQAGAYRALRCYYIAQVLCGLRRWREALAMLERSTTYAAEASAGELEPPLRDKLRALQRDTESCRVEVHANSVLEAAEDAAAAAGGGEAERRGGRGARAPLAERLEEFREEAAPPSRAPNVYRAPPAMEPAPCKPLFFDLACNLVAFPSLDDKTGASDARGGLSGLVKGFLGWGNK